MPVLNALGQGVFDFGEDPGAANVVKVAGNFLIASAMAALALGASEDAGLTPRSSTPPHHTGKGA